jgi:penicillin-binding protein 2
MVWEKLSPRKPQQYYSRLYVLAFFVCLALSGLIIRLLWMQVWQGAEYRRLADSNSVRTVPIRAPRGLILDRHLKVLAGNQPSLSLGLTPAELLRQPELVEPVIARLSQELGLDPEEVRRKFNSQRQRPFAPARLVPDVDKKTLLRLEESRDELPGMVVLEDSKRSYDEPLAAHVLGYVGEITEKELERMGDQGYKLGDLVGQTGLEHVYDGVLKGEDGGRNIRIDAKGRELKVLNETAPRPGNNLVLTLDANLQRAAETALGQNAGAIVALDPRNGDVLAMASKPDFELSNFSGRVRSGVWSRLIADERTPMSNRAIQGLYPPGSVFKIITASAALETGAITPQWKAECLGIYWIATWPYRCWKEVGHGQIAVEQAITESCDIFFYQVGLRTKVEALHKYAQLYGFGEKTGLDLPGERAGLVPDAEWKEETQHMPWFPGNTVMMSIGQGYLLATPLQLACAVSAVANGGVLVQPHLVAKVTSPEGELVSEFHPPKRRELGLKDDTLRLLQRGMAGAVEDRRGTAWRARVEGVSVAGKTGTAQNPHGEDHAVFICFAPVENPQIAISVIVENGGEGGLTAAPMAKAVMDAFFQK